MEADGMLCFATALEALQKHNLVKQVNRADILANMPIRNVSYNSKEVKPGTLFVCKGLNYKKEYLQEALDHGAFCYVSESNQQVSEEIGFILVTDIRKALAVLGAWFYDYQKDHPRIYAVTGTKGKSTTVYFLRNILSAAGEKVAYATTVDIFDGVNAKESTLTTPESLECHRIIRTARDSGCDNFVMEVSSQAYKMDRIYGLDFSYGIFVNITNDHISPNEHCDFEDYFSCKLEIVKKYENAVVNLDDPNVKRVLDAAKNAKQIYTYSVSNRSADFYAANVVKNGFVSSFDLVTPTYTLRTQIKIPGTFNIGNAISAAAVAYMRNIPKEQIIRGIEDTIVPGRMSIYEKNGFTVVVDYAHNKESIAVALQAIREYYPKKNIIVLFGCPGGKALQRRLDMSVECSKYANYVYVSTEDPSYEDPNEIAKEVEGYLNEFHCESEIIVDRDAAIRQAISNLKQNDLLLIAGKGSEHYQVVNGVAQPYGGDTELAEKYINLLK
ncbi:MAG: Mur ligase family protein [Anaerofustis sp.]